jgi:hypothetical protein
MLFTCIVTIYYFTVTAWKIQRKYTREAMAITWFDTCKTEMVANLERQIKEGFYNGVDWLKNENISWHQHLGETRSIDGKQVQLPAFDLDGNDNHGSWQIKDNSKHWYTRHRNLSVLAFPSQCLTVEQARSMIAFIKSVKDFDEYKTCVHSIKEQGDRLCSAIREQNNDTERRRTEQNVMLRRVCEHVSRILVTHKKETDISGYVMPLCAFDCNQLRELIFEYKSGTLSFTTNKKHGPPETAVELLVEFGYGCSG